MQIILSAFCNNPHVTISSCVFVWQNAIDLRGEVGVGIDMQKFCG